MKIKKENSRVMMTYHDPKGDTYIGFSDDTTTVIRRENGRYVKYETMPVRLQILVKQEIPKPNPHYFSIVSATNIDVLVIPEVGA